MKRKVYYRGLSVGRDDKVLQYTQFLALGNYE
jgi:hypothetical protein